MADMQRQHGGHVQLQNTAQQIKLHAVLLFWLEIDLRSNLRALNCEKKNLGGGGEMLPDPSGSTWLRTRLSFSPSNLKYLPPPLTLRVPK